MNRICAQVGKGMDYPASQRLPGRGHTTAGFRHYPQVCRTLETVVEKVEHTPELATNFTKGCPTLSTNPFRG